MYASEQFLLQGFSRVQGKVPEATHAAPFNHWKDDHTGTGPEIIETRRRPLLTDRGRHFTSDID